LHELLNSFTHSVEGIVFTRVVLHDDEGIVDLSDEQVQQQDRSEHDECYVDHDPVQRVFGILVEHREVDLSESALEQIQGCRCGRGELITVQE